MCNSSLRKFALNGESQMKGPLIVTDRTRQERRAFRWKTPGNYFPSERVALEVRIGCLEHEWVRVGRRVPAQQVALGGFFF